MANIPIINPQLVKAATAAYSSGEAPRNQATVQSATVIGSHSVTELSSQPADTHPADNSKSLKHQLVLQIGQQQIKVISDNDWPKGTELAVQLQPDGSLKVIAPNTSTYNANAPDTLEKVLSQLLASRFGLTKDSPMSALTQQLNQLIQTAKTTATNTAPTSDTALEVASAKEQTASNLKSWLNSLPTTQQLKSANSNILTANASTQMSNPQPGNAQASSPQIHNSQVHNPQVSNLQTGATNSATANETPHSTLSPQMLIKSSILNSGIYAEHKLANLMLTQSNTNEPQSISSRFQNLQQSFSQLVHGNKASTDPAKAPSSTDTVETRTINNGLRTAAIDAINANNNENKTTHSSSLSPSSNPSLSPSSTSPANSLSEALKRTAALLNSAINSTQTSQKAPSTESNRPASINTVSNDLILDTKHTLNKSLLQLLQNSLNPAEQPQTAKAAPLQERALLMPLSWPERSPVEPNLVRVMQSIIAHIEREQISQLQNQQSQGQLSSGQGAQGAQGNNEHNAQWFPLMFNHNNQLQQIDLFLEQQSLQEDNEQQKQWLINLHFELENLGSLGIELSMTAQDCQAVFWSEQAYALKEISQHISPLRKSLSEQGILVSELQVKHGTLARKDKNISQRLVDVRT